MDKNAESSATTMDHSDLLAIADREFTSRLFVGTGKFESAQTLDSVIESSGTEMVTVALRRIDIHADFNDQDAVSPVLKRVKSGNMQLLPNTSGARDALEAIRLANLSRELGGGNWVKLEVTPDLRYLLPDPVETLKAAEELVKDDFVVLPYIHADPVLALKLQDAGCATVMPLGSPIGSNQGIRTIESLKIIIEQSRVPVVVDAGIGAPSHAALAMELGADAVLVNTALAVAKNPERTGYAFNLAVKAGRLAWLYGVDSIASTNQQNWKVAQASGPLTGFLDEENR